MGLTKQIKTLSFLLGISTVMASTTCYAGWHHGRGDQHSNYHGRQDGYVYHGRGYYRDNWQGNYPTVVIGVPFSVFERPTYCEDMRVCDGHGGCWIESYCD